MDTTLESLMTSSTGKRHTYTLPPTSLSPSVLSNQKALANSTLPPQFVSLIAHTTSPFVQVVTDVLPPDSSAVFWDGRCILVGDALAGFRPHTAGSTGQAAWHALCISKVFEGEMGWKEWDRTVLEWARKRGREGREMGDRSQFGVHPLADRT